MSSAQSQAGAGASRRRPGPLLWIPVGVALRLLLLVLAGETTLVADESTYLYLGLAWDRFGVLLDTEHYLWPPAYLFAVRACLCAFGAAGDQALHAAQVLLSASIGWGCVRIALRLFGARAAHWAGALWALHLPLAAYTHLTWPETPFLALLVPALALVLEAARPELDARRAGLHLVGAGLLLGLAALVKDVAVGLLPVLGLAVAWSLSDAPAWERARRASLPLLVAAAVLAPWAVRNLWTYGSAAPAGITLGENVYQGLNAHYVNFDHRLVARLHEQGTRVARAARSRFVVEDPTRAWARSNETNTARRSAQNLRRGLGWAAHYPADFALSRIKKAADLIAPQSFLMRHLVLGAYGGPLGSAPLRRVAVVWALAAHLGLFLLALLGLPRLARERTAARVLGTTFVYFLASGMLVAMSRFHLPLVPILIVSASGFLADPRAVGSRRAYAIVVPVLALLEWLWWIDAPEVLEMARLAWG